MNKGLKVLFWNVRSLYTKIDTIRLEVEKVNPDIVNINETWLHDDIDDGFISIKDYILVRSDRQTMENGVIKRGGGLCTFAKKSLICEELTDKTVGNHNIVLHGMKYVLPFTRPIYIVNLYRPPVGDFDFFYRSTKSM